LTQALEIRREVCFTELGTQIWWLTEAGSYLYTADP
jgi:hypothetical protein